jgi:hypothetical protein
VNGRLKRGVIEGLRGVAMLPAASDVVVVVIALGHCQPPLLSIFYAELG